MVGRPALEGFAVDLADKLEAEPVAIFHDSVIALALIFAIVDENALEFLVDVFLGNLNDRLLDLDGLEIHRFDLGQDLVLDLKGQIGVAVENLVDDRLIVRQIDLGLGRGAFFALGSGCPARSN